MYFKETWFKLFSPTKIRSYIYFFILNSKILSGLNAITKKNLEINPDFFYLKYIKIPHKKTTVTEADPQVLVFHLLNQIYNM